MALTIETFDISNITFEDAVKKTFGDNRTYHRIPIKYIKDGKKEDLCIATSELVTYGIQENRKDMKTDNPIESYTLPLIMSDDKLNGIFNKILAACKSHLSKPQISISVEQVPENFAPFVNIMNMFYLKKDKGVIVAGAVPTLYPKLFTKYVKNPDVNEPPPITTSFYDDNGDIDANTLKGVKCEVIAALIIREIYIGSKPSIQIKVNDVYVSKRLSMMKRMLTIPVKPTEKVESVLNNMVHNSPVSSDEEAVKPQPLKIVRRVKE